MSDDILTALREAGVARDSAAFASCAGEPCSNDAHLEVLHSPPGDPGVWVPLCSVHWAATCAGEPTEYIVELHGFIPGFSA